MEVSRPDREDRLLMDRFMREFEKEFPDELSCETRLFEWRWPKGFRCFNCNHEEYYYHNSRKLYQCKKCGHQISLTADTLFEKSRTPLKVWFYMIFALGITDMRVPLSSFINYREKWMGKGDHRRVVLRMAEKIKKAVSSSKRDYLGLVKYYDEDEAD